MNDAMLRGDMQLAAGYVADDVVWHMIGHAEPVRGKAALAQSMAASGGGATITWVTHDVVGNDDHVIALGEATATRGDKSLTYRTAEIYHMKNGQVTERWAFSDDTAAINEFFG
jgi:ketosteroid isomerase-like protein